MNDVFEAVKESKGLLREGTIPPSYASHTDENEQLFIKLDACDNVVVEGEHASFAVEILKNDNLERDIRGMEGDERNGADEIQKEEKLDSATKMFTSMHFLSSSLSPALPPSSSLPLPYPPIPPPHSLSLLICHIFPSPL